MKKKIFMMFGSGIFIVLVLFVSLYVFSFQLNGNSKVNISYGETYKDLGYHANILGISLNKYVKSENNVDTSKLGVYKVTYKLPFKTLEREVTVKDTNAPDLTLNGEMEISLSVGNEYVESGYQALDDIDQDLTNQVEVISNLDINKIGDYKIIYKVSDSSSNQTEKERIIHVIDDISPIISLKGSRTITVKLNGNYEEDGYTALDNYDGDITNKVEVNTNVNYNQVGTYYITYQVVDNSLNKTSVSRTIYVINQIENTYIKGILLVNKKYHLASNYNPGVNKAAYQALVRLQNDASSLGYSLPLLSGFRSYQDQNYLYNSYVRKDGEAIANTYSAKPGQSEHQTGLAFDVGAISDNFGNTESGKWLAENAHKYGFIIRYLKGKESITGYKYEPWHIRYINEEVAAEIYNQGVTLEEYLGVA